MSAAAAAAAALARVGLDTWLSWWTVPTAGLVIAALAFWESSHIWRHSRH